MKQAAKHIFTAIAAIWGSAAYSLGLGEIDVTSQLNQRFTATIPVTGASADELENLRVKLASADDFARAGIESSDLTTKLNFQLQTQGGIPRIVVTSSEAVREPAFSFVLEGRWAGGRLVRTFTVLLDPPSSPVQAATAAPVAKSATGKAAKGHAVAPAMPTPKMPTPVDETSAVPMPTPAPASALTLSSAAVEVASTAPVKPAVEHPAAPLDSASTVSDAGAGETYGPVKPQETLWSVATKLRPDNSVSMNQMLLAIYRTNPSAFSGGLSGLHTGAVLHKPSLAEIRAAGPDEAKLEVDRLRQGLPATSKSAKEPPAVKSAVAASLPSAEPLPAPKPAPLKAEPKAEAAPVHAEPTPEPVAPPSPPPPVAASVPEATSAAATPATPAETPSTVSTGNTAGTPPPASLEGTPPPAPVAPAPVELPKPAPAPVVAQEEEEEDALSPALLIGGSAGVLVLLGYFVVRRSRMKAKAAKEAQATEEPPIGFHLPETEVLTPPTFDVPPQAPETHGDDDLTQISMPPIPDSIPESLADPADAVPNAVDFDFGPADGNSEVNLDATDPLAEADFHLAYGLYDEAVQLLKQVIAREPNRVDLKMKLAETYFAAGRPNDFEECAASLQPMVNPGDWEKLAVMGRQLCPGSNLFGTGLEGAGFNEPMGASMGSSISQSMGSSFKLDSLDDSLSGGLGSSSSNLGTSSLDMPSDWDKQFGLSSNSGMGSSSMGTDLGSSGLGSSGLGSSGLGSSGLGAPGLGISAEKPDDSVFDLSDFDLAVETPKVAEPAPPVVKVGGDRLIEFNLDELDLGVPSDSAAMPPPAIEIAEPVVELDHHAAVGGSDFQGFDQEFGDEAGTKLDLARAYADMGENDAARGLLNEVLNSGNSQQKEEAATLLRRLAS